MIAIPPAAEIIPIFYILKDIGLYASYLGIILIYVTFNIPFAIVLARSFFKAFPRELRRQRGSMVFPIWAPSSG